MPIEHMHTYLVYPNKGKAEPSEIGGTEVPAQGQLFEMLSDVYEKSPAECSIEISFNQAPDGQQHNACRDLLISYIRMPSVETGLAIAQHLSSFTTNRSGLGLLFLLVGREDGMYRVIVSRFPANHGILAEQEQNGLNVEFLERVFLKGVKAYKAVIYEDNSFEAGFWDGKAVDKQINSKETEISSYWIKEFLESDFRTTGAMGTKRLAVALRDASRSEIDLDIKQEIVAAVTLARGFNGRNLNARQFIEQLGLSPAARERVISQFKHPDLTEEIFTFQHNTFADQLPYRSVELNSGAILTGPAGQFDNIFDREEMHAEDGVVRYSTVGRETGAKLGKKK
ncbi:hypothetical protein [Thalassospira indica]|nr:hypothetical protein [Thalassospira indica]